MGIRDVLARELWRIDFDDVGAEGMEHPEWETSPYQQGYYDNADRLLQAMGQHMRGLLEQNDLFEART